MKILFVVFIALILTGNHAVADDGFLLGDIHYLAGDNILTGEYSWSNGKFSGFGFADIIFDSDDHFTDHELRFTVYRDTYVLTEVGHTTFGGTMLKTGIGSNISNLSFLNNNFVFLNLFAQKTISGPGGEYILGTAWQTKTVQITESIAVYASGFADFQKNAPNVVQPQVWFTFGESPIEVGGEISIFGDTTTYSLAVKFMF